MTIGIVTGTETGRQGVLLKNARRYYADLNCKVYYFKSHSSYWLALLGKMEFPLVALDMEVSARLERHGVRHSVFGNYESIRSYLVSLH